MATAADVYGLMPSQEVERAVQDLEVHGVLPVEIEVRHPEPGRYRLHDESLHVDARSALRGGVIGGVIGVAVGIGALLLLDGFTSMGGMLWVLMGAGGFGLLIGGVVGLATHDTTDSDPDRFAEVDSQADLQLVCVHCLHWRNRAHRVLERHGARFVESPQPR